MLAHIPGLFRYPIKGLSCEPMPSVALQPGRGVPGDRRPVWQKFVRIEVHIKQSDGKDWIVLCDGTSGKILSTIDVDAP